MPDSVIQSVVKEAHSRGKPVFVHPTTTDGLMASVRAGVDVLAHTTPQSGPWNESVLARDVAGPRRAHSDAVVLALPDASRTHFSGGRRRGNGRWPVAQLGAAGGDGAVRHRPRLGDEYDPTVEYVLMAKAGMTFPQILASLTTAPAERFGDSARLGRIAPGFIADLTMMRADPSKDIRALSAVDYTIRDGKVIYRSSH